MTEPTSLEMTLAFWSLRLAWLHQCVPLCKSGLATSNLEMRFCFAASFLDVDNTFGQPLYQKFGLCNEHPKTDALRQGTSFDTVLQND